MYVSSVEDNDMYIGCVMPFAFDQPDFNFWLLCDFSEISRVSYKKLFEKIGVIYGNGDGSTTFNVPEIRGEFIRCLDSGRGIDIGRQIGTLQLDEFKNHSHQVGRVCGGYGGLQFNGGAGMADINPFTSANGGNETRPINIALPYFIKFR